MAEPVQEVLEQELRASEALCAELAAQIKHKEESLRKLTDAEAAPVARAESNAATNLTLENVAEKTPHMTWQFSEKRSYTPPLGEDYSRDEQSKHLRTRVNFDMASSSSSHAPKEWPRSETLAASTMPPLRERPTTSSSLDELFSRHVMCDATSVTSLERTGFDRDLQQQPRGPLTRLAHQLSPERRRPLSPMRRPLSPTRQRMSSRTSSPRSASPFMDERVRALQHELHELHHTNATKAGIQHERDAALRRLLDKASSGNRMFESGPRGGPVDEQLYQEAELLIHERELLRKEKGQLQNLLLKATDEIQRLLEKEGRYKDDLKHAVLASTQATAEAQRLEDEGRRELAVLRERLEELEMLRRQHEDEKAEISARVDELMRHNDDVQARMDAMLREREKASAADELHAEAKAAAEKERLLMIAELKALEAEVGRKTNEASSAEANVKALTDELDVLRRQAAEATKSLDHAHAQLEATRHETEEVRDFLARIKKEKLELQHEKEQLLRDKLSSQRRWEELYDEAAVMRTKCAEYDAARTEWSQLDVAMHAQVAQLQEQRDSGLGEIEALRKYIRKAKAEADEALTKAARENLHYQNLLQEAQAEVARVRAETARHFEEKNEWLKHQDFLLDNVINARPHRAKPTRDGEIDCDIVDRSTNTSFVRNAKPAAQVTQDDENRRLREQLARFEVEKERWERSHTELADQQHRTETLLEQFVAEKRALDGHELSAAETSLGVGAAMSGGMLYGTTPTSSDKAPVRGPVTMAQHCDMALDGSNSEMVSKRHHINDSSLTGPDTTASVADLKMKNQRTFEKLMRTVSDQRHDIQRLSVPRSQPN